MEKKKQQRMRPGWFRYTADGDEKFYMVPAAEPPVCCGASTGPREDRFADGWKPDDRECKPCGSVWKPLYDREDE